MTVVKNSVEKKVIKFLIRKSKLSLGESQKVLLNKMKRKNKLQKIAILTIFTQKVVFTFFCNFIFLVVGMVERDN